MKIYAVKTFDISEEKLEKICLFINLEKRRISRVQIFQSL